MLLYRFYNDFSKKNPHTVEVTGSNPVPPTRTIKGCSLGCNLAYLEGPHLAEPSKQLEANCLFH
jgi:hypothetical protein